MSLDSRIFGCPGSLFSDLRLFPCSNFAHIYPQGSGTASNQEFIHILIARHRPQSNGIAERFVRTLKVWLRDKSWQTEEELAALLHQFLSEYNDRLHQGLLIPGLSPNVRQAHLAL